MKKFFPPWLLGLIATLAVILIPVAIFWPRIVKPLDDPRAKVPQHPTHTSHANLMNGPYESGPDVTRACLECHADAATQVMATTHWTWESEPFNVPWRDEAVTIGKINQINNFCIGAQGNQKQCMSCHAGYGWADDQAYDFSNQENVDCLACHADTATYGKGSYGNPSESVDLVEAARSVRNPTRDNCGSCHFNGGGGNGVKHGDLDESLYFPSESLDVHMGREDFLCTDCHWTEDHQILGRLVVDNYTIDPAEQVACTNCHTPGLHDDERINLHIETVACQTCHIPAMALTEPTKTFWDWSTAGQDLPEDHYTYLKIKGTFEYKSDILPTYTWFNGNLAYRYLLGDPIAEAGPTYINLPAGDIDDPKALIYPFKVHVANQPYDVGNNYLLSPITAGPEGYWTNFDWDQAFTLAEAAMGLDYSGEYGFTETWMYWPTSHMVQSKDNALQCTDCHSENGRLDWAALGYPGDPIVWGGRSIDK
ncbi:MAG TPA: tetrathionate reductase family octaheme c-type cytochrome [Anaerolineales bacterium]|nr:tetrathionate reductase family octaheme c-type cytochrome [Anaerolineales bacterium]